MVIPIYHEKAKYIFSSLLLSYFLLLLNLSLFVISYEQTFGFVFEMTLATVVVGN